MNIPSIFPINKDLVKNVSIGVLVALIFMLIWDGCNAKRDAANLTKQLSEYKIGEKEFTVKRNKDSSTIAQQSQTILTQKEAIALGLLKLDGQIKKAQSQVTQTQNTSIKKIEVAFVPDNFADTTIWLAKFKKGDRSKDIIDSLVANSIVVPKKFSDTTNKWYKVSGEVTKKAVDIDSFTITNQSTVTVGYKKSGFLGFGRTPVVEVKNTNPYLSVSSVNNVVVKENKGFFKTTGFKIGIGVLLGLLAHNYIK